MKISCIFNAKCNIYILQISRKKRLQEKLKILRPNPVLVNSKGDIAIQGMK